MVLLISITHTLIRLEQTFSHILKGHLEKWKKGKKIFKKEWKKKKKNFNFCYSKNHDVSFMLQLYNYLMYKQ